MGEPTQPERNSDDRLLVPTRVLAIVIIPVLVAAFVILFGFPGDTKRLWAWTINPNLTAAVMGAAYLAGSWFFTRSVFDGRWHRVSLGWLAVIPFTLFLGVTTFIHWDRFNHDHVSFWAWLLLYVVTPIALPALWLMNQRAASNTATSPELELPQPLRWMVAAGGAVLLLAATVIFVRPQVAISRWPWGLTPLTARTLACFATFLAAVWLAFAVTGRWSRLAIPFEATTVGLAMVAVAVIRSHGDLDSGRRATTFVVLLVLAVAWSLSVLVWATRRARARPIPTAH